MLEYHSWYKFVVVFLFLFGNSEMLEVVVNTPTVNEYISAFDYGIDIREVENISFDVIACHDVHVALAMEKDIFQTNTLEIVLGGWTNGKSVIRLSPQGDEKVSISGPVLNCTHKSRFVISWSNDSLKVWSRNELYMEYSGLPHPINYLGIATGFRAAGKWYFEVPDVSSPITANSGTSLSNTHSEIWTMISCSLNCFESTHETLPFSTTSSTVLDTSSVQSTSFLFNSRSLIVTSSTMNDISSLLSAEETVSPSPHNYPITSYDDMRSFVLNDVTLTPSMDIMTSFAVRETPYVDFNITTSYESVTSYTDLNNTTSAVTLNITPSYNVSSNYDMNTSFPVNSTLTSIMDSTETRSKIMCSCVCPNLKTSQNSISNQIKKELILNRRKLSTTKRKYISIPDDRPGAVSLGVFGILCLLFVLLVIAVPDILGLCRYFYSNVQ